MGLNDDYSIEHLGPVKWDIALCLLAVFVIVYFAMWKGVKSSGKVQFRISTVIGWEFSLSLLKQSKNLDPSHQTDLDFGIVLEGKTINS